jgi:hypothetical protein
MPFRAKAKKKARPRKTTIPNKARAYSAPPKAKTQFAPARATAASLKGKDGPSLMDLLCLHFKDLGYQCKMIPSGGDNIILSVDVTPKMPYVGAVGLRGATGVSSATVEFFYDEKMVFYRKQWPYGVIREGTKALMIPLGGAEDPHLVKRMEGIVGAYLGGATQLSVWVRAALK